MEYELLEPVVLNGPGVQVRISDEVKIHVPDPIKVRVTGDTYVAELVIRPDPITLNPAIDEVLSIRKRGDRPIPNDVLRSLRLGRGVLETVVRENSVRSVRKGNRWVAANFQGEEPNPKELRRVFTSAVPRTVRPAEVEKAAEVYRAAVKAGRRDATMAVAEALNVSRPTAARRLDKARQQGLLGPAARTKAGEA